MWRIFLLVGVASCFAATEFSSRPTNVSLLLLHFTRQEVNKPIFIGTFGLWSLMAGLSFGAHGDTGREIFRSFLLLTDQNKFNTQYKNLTNILFDGDARGVVATNKNYFFMDRDFLVLPDFRKMLQDYYDTTFKVLDFEDPNSASIANQYIIRSSQFQRNVFHFDDFKDTSIIMSNVQLFKGEWTLPFNTLKTRVEFVTSTQGKRGAVPMMKTRGKVPYIHMESMKASVMELLYGSDGKYSMLILTPDSNVTVEEVYRNFEKVTFRDIFAELGTSTKEVDVNLPRFSKQSRLTLNKPLNDMGIYDPFEPSFAKFGKMVREPIYIGNIDQNAVIEVTESGTVAFSSIPGVNVAVLNLDENQIMPPFIYFIMEKSTATVLFSGIF